MPFSGSQRPSPVPVYIMPLLTDRGAGASPHSATRRSPRADFIRRQIVDVDHIRIAAAALRGVRVDDVVAQIQRVGLAVGRHELGGWGDLFARRQVQAAQRAVPGRGVDGVLARSLSRPDDRCRGDAAGTENARAAPTAGGRIQSVSK